MTKWLLPTCWYLLNPQLQQSFTYCALVVTSSYISFKSQLNTQWSIARFEKRLIENLPQWPMQIPYCLKTNYWVNQRKLAANLNTLRNKLTWTFVIWHQAAGQGYASIYSYPGVKVDCSKDLLHWLLVQAIFRVGKAKII